MASGSAHEADSAYAAVVADNDSTRWAYGTGFADPLDGVDTTIPAGVDGADLAAYCLMLGDDALIMSHRLQEWCARAPELEDEVALANVALDLLGQARLLLTRAGAADSTILRPARQNDGTSRDRAAEVSLPGRDEDALAFLRDEASFRNVRLVEAPNGDFAHTMARLLVFATWRLALLDRLTRSLDPVLAAVAAKGVKEVTYHRDYAARWVVRLGDGTDVSHARMRDGLAAVWPLVGELFTPHPVELRLAAAGVGVDPSAVRAEFDDVLAEVLTAATLTTPDVPQLPGVAGRTGRHGVHTETMGHLLAELQSVARAHPEATW